MSGVGVVFASFALKWCSGMVTDGFQAQKRSSWIPGKERAERDLASAISIDGTKKWDVHILLRIECVDEGVAGAVTLTSLQGCVGSTGRRSPRGRESGLRAPQRRAGRKTERPGVWKQRTRNSVQGLMPWKTRVEKEPKEGRVSLQGKKETWKMCGEEDMDIEDGTESCKKLDEQKRKLQKELLDVERRSLIFK